MGSHGSRIIVIGTLKPPKEPQRSFPFEFWLMWGSSEVLFPKVIYKQDPDLTREGGSIPITLTFAEALGVNVLLLPMGRGDDGAQ